MADQPFLTLLLADETANWTQDLACAACNGFG